MFYNFFSYFFYYFILLGLHVAILEKNKFSKIFSVDLYSFKGSATRVLKAFNYKIFS